MHLEFVTEMVGIIIIVFIYMILNETYFKKHSPSRIVRLAILEGAMAISFAIGNVVSIFLGTYEPYIWLIDLAIIVVFGIVDLFVLWISYKKD